MIYKKLNLSINPFALYSLISQEYENSFLLESLEGKDKLARFSFIGFDPSKIVSATDAIVSSDNQETDSKEPLRALANEIPKIKLEKEGFLGGAVGYFSYDYIRNLERIGDNDNKKNTKHDFPDFEFGIFNDCIAYDHRDRSVHYISHSTDRSSIIESLVKNENESQEEQQPFNVKGLKANIDKSKFEKMVETAKEKIVDGDIFQVVLSRKYESEYTGNPLSFYNYLKQTNPSPYMYYLSFGDRKIVGSSPENLVRVEGKKIDSYATLAGTIHRGKTIEEDKLLEQKLLTDPKERAEHLMLVDLTRNDLGKVSEPGSVHVPELMEIHKYRYVQHIGSHVAGTLADGKDCFDALNAIFPAGTLSGAPKVRAMEIIEALEPDCRGPYGGAVGYFSFNGNCDFAITIRTLVANKKQVSIQAGAGIVYDSIPEKEYEETENKLRALTNALDSSKVSG
ncbi:anthranilate synthase component I [Candidatus Micrarchaeota archaeon]|nr:anthranilate synthase component I [Candidatus Micrarchaeota archaeon]